MVLHETHNISLIQTHGETINVARVSLFMFSNCKKAFTLIEILMVVLILGILAAIVIPQFSSASQEARQTAMKESLRLVRSQCELYRAEHAGRTPGYPSGGGDPTEAVFKSQMQQFTSLAGVVSATSVAGYKGPYLLSFPVNPLTSSDTVTVLTDAQNMPAAGSDTAGWIYKPATLKFRPDSSGADDNGILYFDY